MVTGYDRRGRGTGSDRRPVYYPRYEYRGPDGRVYRGASDTVSDCLPREGATLQVAVNPENPAESVPEGTAGVGVIGRASIAIGTIGIAMFWFIRMFPLP